MTNTTYTPKASKLSPEEIAARSEKIRRVMEEEKNDKTGNSLFQDMAHNLSVAKFNNVGMAPIYTAKISSAITALAQNPNYQIPEHNSRQLYHDVQVEVRNQEEQARAL